MEFNGDKRANEYCNSIEERNPYEDFLNGYNKALEDTKAPEMLEMLQKVLKRLPQETDADINIYYEARELIKQATKL